MVAELDVSDVSSALVLVAELEPTVEVVSAEVTVDPADIVTVVVPALTVERTVVVVSSWPERVAVPIAAVAVAVTVWPSYSKQAQALENAALSKSGTSALTFRAAAKTCIARASEACLRPMLGARVTVAVEAGTVTTLVSVLQIVVLRAPTVLRQMVSGRKQDEQQARPYSRAGVSVTVTVVFGYSIRLWQNAGPESLAAKA